MRQDFLYNKPNRLNRPDRLNKPDKLNKFFTVYASQNYLGFSRFIHSFWGRTVFCQVKQKKLKKDKKNLDNKKLVFILLQ